VRFDLPAGPRYAVGPYFDLVDEVMLKHEVTVPLKSPALVGLYEISKEQFDNDAGDSALLRKANSVSKEWVRWASIVLAIVSEKQEETSKLMSKGLAQLGNDPITSKNYQGLNVGLLEAGSKVSIRDIIKQYGEPSGRRTTKKSLKKDEAEVEFDVYSFDVIELQCRKGSDDVEWLNAPMMWFVEGIRKKAQRTLERAK
jgi:hypothetical protein